MKRKLNINFLRLHALEILVLACIILSTSITFAAYTNQSYKKGVVTTNGSQVCFSSNYLTQCDIGIADAQYGTSTITVSKQENPASGAAATAELTVSNHASDDASSSEASSSSEQLSSSALSDASSVENSSSIDMLTAEDEAAVMAVSEEYPVSFDEVKVAFNNDYTLTADSTAFDTMNIQNTNQLILLSQLDPTCYSAATIT